MTKNFCDICGDPAEDQFPEFLLKQKDKEWRGSKHSSDGVGVVDGVYTPTFSARAVFEMENQSQGNSRRRFPDLCNNCMVSLLMGLCSKLKGSQ